MDATNLEIDGLKLLHQRRFADARGYFVESWNRKTFAAAGIDVDFVQDNESFSMLAGTVRGLHFQKPPRAQAKLIRVLRGAVFDVAVDIRRKSRTFGRHASAVLTAEGGEQLFIPAGFAHGLCTLEPDTEVQYKVSDFYSRDDEAGILWSDPALAIDWPLGGADPVVSEKDRTLPLLAALKTPF